MIRGKRCSAGKCERDSTCSYEYKTYCLKHYKQLVRHGYVLERTSRDKNEIILGTNFAQVVMYDKKGVEITRAKIDLEDVEKVSLYKWKYNKYSGYIENRNIKLHNLIMGFKGNRFVQVDHIDRNKLDCRKQNLRIVTSQENIINRGMQKNNKSGVKGVSLIRKINKWYAPIGFGGKTYNLGVFKNKEEAIVSRKKAEIKFFGEYCK